MNEVAKQENRPRHPMVMFKEQLDQLAHELPSSPEMPIERMKSVAIVAVTKDPELLQADRQSLFSAIRECAASGLVPDGNEGFLNVYNTKVKRDGKDAWIKQVKFMPMVRGIVKRVRNSGRVKTFWAEVVFEGEQFTLEVVDGNRRPVHEPDWFNRTGEIVGAYAVATLPNGAVEIEVMDRKQLDKVRNSAKTKNVWDNWHEEKCKVAVMRRLAKRLPVSAQDLNIIMGDEHDFENRVKEIAPPKKGGFAQMAMGARQIEHTDQSPAIEAEDVSQDEDPFPGATEYTEGGIAFEEGRSVDDCPYEDGQHRIDWIGGFKKAEEDAS